MLNYTKIKLNSHEIRRCYAWNRGDAMHGIKSIYLSNTRRRNSAMKGFISLTHPFPTPHLRPYTFFKNSDTQPYTKPHPPNITMVCYILLNNITFTLTKYFNQFHCIKYTYIYQFHTTFRFFLISKNKITLCFPILLYCYQIINFYHHNGLFSVI